MIRSRPVIRARRPGASGFLEATRCESGGPARRPTPPVRGLPRRYYVTRLGFGPVGPDSPHWARTGPPRQRPARRPGSAHPGAPSRLPPTDPVDRPLYIHQRRASQKVGPANFVVSPDPLPRETGGLRFRLRAPTFTKTRNDATAGRSSATRFRSDAIEESPCTPLQFSSAMTERHSGSTMPLRTSWSSACAASDEMTASPGQAIAR